MNLKIIGAVLVLAGCGGCGFAMAAAQRREEQCLRQLLRALEYMDCELQFRQPPLPLLCHNTAGILTGPMALVFEHLYWELEAQTAPDAGYCMRAVLTEFPGLAERVREALSQLGSTLGRFDLPGQQKGLSAVGAYCRCAIDELSQNRSSRLRSYQTLGLCTGAALAILFL